MIIDLRHLRTLVALRNTGSLVEAADQVNLTQSALSHQIKDLEDRLEYPLFIRKTKPIKFTAAGERLLRLADEILPSIRNAERDLVRLAKGRAGRLNIAIECHSCFQWLMPTLNLYRDRWPEVELDLTTGFNFAPLPALQRGELDLVITSDPQDIGGLSYVPLFSYETLLSIGKHHPLSQKAFIEPADLASENLIMYPVDRSRLDIFRLFLDPANIEPTGVRTAELTLMMIQLVASGRGVCALPNWALTEYLERDYVAAKRLGEAGIWATLYAAVRTESQNLLYIQDFLDTARDTSFKTLVGIKPMPTHTQAE